MTGVDCVPVVNDRRNEMGMTIRALAKKTGIPENALYATLCGNRKMTATELLSLSMVLGLNFDDFQRCGKAV